MTISKERMERIQGIVTDYLDHEEIGEQDGVTAGELRALLRLARLAEDAAATIEALRAERDGLREALLDFYDGECKCHENNVIKPCCQCKAGAALAAGQAGAEKP